MSSSLAEVNVYSTCHLCFLSIPTRLKARVHTEKIQVTREIVPVAGKSGEHVRLVELKSGTKQVISMPNVFRTREKSCTLFPHLTAKHLIVIPFDFFTLSPLFFSMIMSNGFQERFEMSLFAKSALPQSPVRG